MSKPLVLIAAGGTGGHLFPALALSQELRRRGFECDLVTDMRGGAFDADFPAREVHRVPSATLYGRSPVAAARAALTLLCGVWQAWRLIGLVKPRIVAGFGGYPTVPPLIAARLRGVGVVIHEQNAVMGRANRLLARIACAIGLSFERTGYLHASGRAKVQLVGTPVRDAVLAAIKPYTRPSPKGAFRLLVFGGSQGARVFSDIVPEALEGLPRKLKSRLKLVQQVREEDMGRVRDLYARAGIDAELATFFADLPERMAAAHLVIARSGASSVAELCVLGRPAILVPLPHALDNDQLENATRVQDVGGAWCVEQRVFTARFLGSEIARLAAAPEELVRAAKAARAMGQPGAVTKLADLIEEL